MSHDHASSATNSNASSLNREGSNASSQNPEGATALKRGWTTGACATAATKAALTALLTGTFQDPVTITLPKGEKPSFPLTDEKIDSDSAMAAIIKDAGDDPDVTHGATIRATVRRGIAGEGIRFYAGRGVGMVTKAGLPIDAGEPAINPVPRQMMRAEVEALCIEHNIAPDFAITISIDDGEALALKTWNPRLGIVGGLSVLGTTGIVHPFSCSAWIHSIHRGIDVARAQKFERVIAATGSTSEATAQAIYNLPEIALIDMGDFAGGVLKYLRHHPLPSITIAGGFAKLTKLAQGAMDLHSGRSQVNMDFLADIAIGAGLNQDIKIKIQSANTAMEALEIATQNNIDIALPIALKAHEQAVKALKGAPVSVEIIITNRNGKVLARV